MRKAELFQGLREVLRTRTYSMPDEKPYQGTGAPGIYLENLLHLKAGNQDIPDAGGWEVKFYTQQTALITLFHKEPEPKDIMRRMLEQWGWKDAKGRKSLRHTIKGKSDRFRVVNDNDRIVVKPLDGNGVSPCWPHDILLNIAGSKLRRLLLVKGKRTQQKMEYLQADCFEDMILTELVSEIVRGTVCIDFDLRTAEGNAIRNHGTKFRVIPDDVCRLYLIKHRFI